MSITPIRTAVLGYGLAGRVFHCPFISAIPGLELTAIVQRTGDSAAADYPNARILRSLDDAFADPNLDLLVVATPNDTHFELARKALEAGKNIVIDKPITGTSAEVRTLISLAMKQGKVLAPFHNRRFDGDFLTLRSLLANATLSRIVTIESHFDRFRPQQRSGNWKEAPGQINGLLYDLGPHLLDQALALFGPPQTITASVRFDRDTTAIDDAFDIILTYSISGHTLRYGCHASMIAADVAPRFRVHGTLGSFVKYGLDPQEQALKDGARPPQLDSNEPWLSEPESDWGTLTQPADPNNPAELQQTKIPTLDGDYRLFYAGVRDAINNVAPLSIPAEDAFRTIKLLELALQSSEEQRTLPVSFSE